MVRKCKKWKYMKQRHCLNFSWNTSPRLPLNLTYVLTSSRLSIEIFLGRKAARMSPQVLSLRLISYSIAEQFQVSMMLWVWW